MDSMKAAACEWRKFEFGANRASGSERAIVAQADDDDDCNAIAFRARAHTHNNKTRKGSLQLTHIFPV